MNIILNITNINFIADVYEKNHKVLKGFSKFEKLSMLTEHKEIKKCLIDNPEILNYIFYKLSDNEFDKLMSYCIKIRKGKRFSRQNIDLFFNSIELINLLINTDKQKIKIIFKSLVFDPVVNVIKINIEENLKYVFSLDLIALQILQNLLITNNKIYLALFETISQSREFIELCKTISPDQYDVINAFCFTYKEVNKKLLSIELFKKILKLTKPEVEMFFFLFQVDGEFIKFVIDGFLIDLNKYFDLLLNILRDEKNKQDNFRKLYYINYLYLFYNKTVTQNKDFIVYFLNLPINTLEKIYNVFFYTMDNKNHAEYLLGAFIESKEYFDILVKIIEKTPDLNRIKKMIKIFRDLGSFNAKVPFNIKIPTDLLKYIFLEITDEKFNQFTNYIYDENIERSKLVAILYLLNKEIFEKFFTLNEFDLKFILLMSSSESVFTKIKENPSMVLQMMNLTKSQKKIYKQLFFTGIKNEYGDPSAEIYFSNKELFEILMKILGEK